MGSLLLSLEAIRETGPLNEEQIQFLLMAEKSLETVIGMVDRMIDISVVEDQGTAALNLQTAEICQLVEVAGYQVAPLAHRKKIHFEASADGSLAVVDGSKFIRVIVNLLANAVKFTGEGGVVRLRAGRIEESSGDWLSIMVSDSGIGIPAEHLSRIFEEGYRVDRNAPTQRSTGLGLTFCKRIVESHGGTISVASEVGTGSVFTVRVPLDRGGPDQHPKT
jgi:signal transduction histidine kinase